VTRETGVSSFRPWSLYPQGIFLYYQMNRTLYFMKQCTQLPTSFLAV